MDTWKDVGLPAKSVLDGTILAAMDRLTAGVDDRDIVGIGIFTDADAQSVVAAANTRGNYEALVEADPEGVLDYRWSIGDWDRTPFEVAGADLLAACTPELRRAATEAEARGGATGLHRQRVGVWSAIATALARLHADGSLARWPHAVRVFIPMDGDVSEETVADWNEACNSAEAGREFREWFVVDDRYTS